MNNEEFDPVPDDDCPEYGAEFWENAVRGPFDPADHPRRKRVRLALDVEKFFADEDAVNEALRTLIKLQPQLSEPTSNDPDIRAKSA